MEKLTQWSARLFEDIGWKIKRFAQALFWIELMGGVIGAIGMLFAAESFWMLLAALLVILLSPFVAWATVALLYAFGELVDKATKINEKLQLITEPIVQQNRIREEALEQERQQEYRREQQQREKRLREEAERIAREAEQRAQEQAQKTAQTQKAINKQMSLQEQLAYALRFQTDEGMIRFLRTIDNPVVAGILEGPAESVRETVEKLLETM